MNDIAEVQQEFWHVRTNTSGKHHLRRPTLYIWNKRFLLHVTGLRRSITYWADLLILAAREQGLPEPSFDPFVRGPYDSVVLADGKILSDLPLGQALPTQDVSILKQASTNSSNGGSDL